MFSALFGKKEDDQEGHVFSDRAYMSTPAKMKACAALAGKDPDLLFIAWFEDTARQFRQYFSENNISENRITEARYVHQPQLLSKKPVFLEHYPLHSTETELIKNWDHKKIPVYSALDEPLFKHFGSEKILPMLKLMGMKEDEAMEHPLVSKSILKGQEKIREKVMMEKSALSQAEWMQKNLGETL